MTKSGRRFRNEERARATDERAREARERTERGNRLAAIGVKVIRLA